MLSTIWDHSKIEKIKVTYGFYFLTLFTIKLYQSVYEMLQALTLDICTLKVV